MTGADGMSGAPAADRPTAAAGDTRCEVVLVALPAELSPVLRRRLEPLTFGDRPQQQRPETLVARALAGRLLAARHPAAAGTLRQLDSGKPVADGASLSISHTAGVVAVAVCARGPLGIDIERVGRPRPRVAGRVFAEQDAAGLAALPEADQPLAFTRLWTVAEACTKLTGEGLGRLFGGLGPLGLGASGQWSGSRWSSRIVGPGLVVSLAGPPDIIPAAAWVSCAAIVA